MSTGKNNLNPSPLAHRIATLSSQPEVIFHTSDLATLWNIQNQNTLHTTISRYVRAGILHAIYRGLYSILPPKNIDPIVLGAKALHSYCYLSTESILFGAGFISHAISAHTFVNKASRQFALFGHAFKSRRLDSRFLYNPTGIKKDGSIKVATIERAICDMLYFNPHFHFDRPIAWGEIKAMQQEIGYPLTEPRYAFANT